MTGPGIGSCKIQQTCSLFDESPHDEEDDGDVSVQDVSLSDCLLEEGNHGLTISLLYTHIYINGENDLILVLHWRRLSSILGTCY